MATSLTLGWNNERVDRNNRGRGFKRFASLLHEFCNTPPIRASRLIDLHTGEPSHRCTQFIVSLHWLQHFLIGQYEHYKHDKGNGIRLPFASIMECTPKMRH